MFDEEGKRRVRRHGADEPKWWKGGGCEEDKGVERIPDGGYGGRRHDGPGGARRRWRGREQPNDLSVAKGRHAVEAFEDSDDGKCSILVVNNIDRLHLGVSKIADDVLSIIDASGARMVDDVRRVEG